MKITAPDHCPQIMPRQTIINAINSTSLHELIYLAAPYGCGKTMAVLSWLHTQGGSATWVNLSINENTPLAFWAALAASLLSLPQEPIAPEDIMRDQHFLEGPQAFFHMAKQACAMATEKILILDNFQYIMDPALLREIKKVFTETLGSWRIIIIGRSELPPLISDFVLRKRLRLCTLPELTFSLPETNEYFLMNGITAGEKELRQIHEDTGGWPAALNAILTAPYNRTLQYGETAKGYVNQYLEEEAWAPLSEAVKAFLMKTSLLEILSPSICHYVTGMEETHLILRDLYTNGIFIFALESRDTYCYHRVFRDFLFEKLTHSGIDVNSLYVKAGWWFYERNESNSALRCFYEARNIYGINMTFKKMRPADMGMEKYIELASCLTSLDPNSLKEAPEVAARIALLHFIMGNIFETKRIYEILLEWCSCGLLPMSSEEYVDLFWEIGWLRNVNPDVDIFFNSQYDEWMNIMEYAPHLLESDRSRASVLRFPSALRGPRDFSADVARFEEYYEANVQSGYRFVHEEIVLFIFELAIAEIAYEREEFNKADTIIRKIMPRIEELKLTDLYFAATCLLVKLSRAAHDPSETAGLTARAETLIMNNRHFFLLPNFHAFELRNRLAEGALGPTKIFMEENQKHTGQSYYYLMYRHITFVRSLLSEAKFSEAKLMLGNLELLCRQYQRGMDLVEVNILRCITDYGLGYQEDSCRHLKTAIELARASGFIRIFSDDAAALWPVLSLTRKSDSDAYVKKIIISCKKALSRAGVMTQAEKIESGKLTKKEKLILKKLQTGMSYDEIALDCQIKVGTARTHIHSIYSKLNVNNKVSAIVLAQNNGII